MSCRFGGAEEIRGKFQLYIIALWMLQEGSRQPPAWLQGLLGNPVSLNQQLAATGTPAPSHAPGYWWPCKFPSVEEDAERHTTVSELIFLLKIPLLASLSQLRQPKDLQATCSSGFQLPKQTPCQLHRNFRFNLGELESPSWEGGERTWRRRGGKTKKTAVALCPISPECVTPFCPAECRALALGMPAGSSSWAGNINGNGVRLCERMIYRDGEWPFGVAPNLICFSLS